ncbi:MAG: hypothetical protein XD98_0542 [Microgenomates bacterium 39_6]|nr:MAG: hypothetical protein XD98_0542 [Microgenomates bacterium 39_6]
MTQRKKIKIGFDLDGVIVGRPPLVPKRFLERLFRGGKEGLVYRFPDNKINRFLRKLSHHYFFRPPIKDNLTFLKKLAQDPDVEVYLISGRYGFLKKETQEWLDRWGVNNGLAGIFLNEENLPPHIFKEKILKKLDLDVYLEDDEQIVSFLKEKIPQTKFYWVDDENFNLPVLL